MGEMRGLRACTWDGKCFHTSLFNLIKVIRKGRVDVTQTAPTMDTRYKKYHATK